MVLKTTVPATQHIFYLLIGPQQHSLLVVAAVINCLHQSRRTAVRLHHCKRQLSSDVESAHRLLKFRYGSKQLKEQCEQCELISGAELECLLCGVVNISLHLTSTLCCLFRFSILSSGM